MVGSLTVGAFRTTGPQVRNVPVPSTEPTATDSGEEKSCQGERAYKGPVELERKALEEEKDILEGEEEEQRWEELHAEIAKEAESHVAQEKDGDDEELKANVEDTTEFRRFKDQHWKAGTHVYDTCVTQGTCTCPDREVAGYVCKHLFCALMEMDGKFTDLPSHLVNAPHLSIDVDVVEQNQYAMEGVTSCNDDALCSDEATMDTTEEGITRPTHRRCGAPEPQGLDANPEVENTSENRRARFFSAMKQLSAMWHNGRLSEGMENILANTVESLQEQARADEKSRIDQGDDFTLRGPCKRKRKVNDSYDNMKHGMNENEDTKGCAHEFPSQSTKGRPRQKKQNISKGILGDVNWQVLENAGNVNQLT
mgnify:FL=1|jgi:hypothetical protein